MAKKKKNSGSLSVKIAEVYHRAMGTYLLHSEEIFNGSNVVEKVMALSVAGLPQHAKIQIECKFGKIPKDAVRLGDMLS